MFIGCTEKAEVAEETPVSAIQAKADEYTVFSLTTDISALSENQKQMIPLLIETAKIMDGIFWKEAYGDRAALMASLPDEITKHYAEINYGPWDRLRADESFVEGVGEKPAGAQFYPADMTKEEFDAWENDDKMGQYSIVKRDEEGALYTVAYREEFAEEVTRAAELLRKAAELAEDESLKNYLTLRADALLSDDYLESDMAWMDMKTNTIEMVVGPIENYEDK